MCRGTQRRWSLLNPRSLGFCSEGGFQTLSERGEGEEFVDMNVIIIATYNDDPEIRLAVAVLLLGAGEPSSQEDILAIRNKIVGVPQQVRMEIGSC